MNSSKIRLIFAGIPWRILPNAKKGRARVYNSLATAGLWSSVYRMARVYFEAAKMAQLGFASRSSLSSRAEPRLVKKLLDRLGAPRGPTLSVVYDPTPSHILSYTHRQATTSSSLDSSSFIFPLRRRCSFDFSSSAPATSTFSLTIFILILILLHSYPSAALSLSSSSYPRPFHIFCLYRVPNSLTFLSFRHSVLPLISIIH